MDTQREISQRMTLNALGIALSTRMPNPLPNQLVGTENFRELEFHKLQFFETIKILIKPAELLPTHLSGDYVVQKSNFRLTCEEIDKIRESCYQINGKNNYKVKVLVRFGRNIVDHTQTDTFPPGLRIYVNEHFRNLLSLMPENYQSEYHDWPLDITPFLKFTPDASDQIKINWLRSASKFAMGVYLVKTLTSDDLFTKLLAKSSQPAFRTINNIKSKFEEENGIVPTTLTISLKCPLSKRRIVTPCQSSICNHLQCFDAEAFLQLNEKSHSWKCPICDSLAEFDYLKIDNYFEEILASNKLTGDDICLLPDGSWENFNYETGDSTIVVEDNDTILISDSIFIAESSLNSSSDSLIFVDSNIVIID